MKKLKFLILLILCPVFLMAQKTKQCPDITSDARHYRYTAEGVQIVVNGDHSRAINEARRMASVYAESELATMVKSSISRVADKMLLSDSEDYGYIVNDTTRVSALQYFKNIHIICVSEPEFKNNSYKVYVTKEISIYDVGDMLFESLPDGEKKDKMKQSFVESLSKDNKRRK